MACEHLRDTKAYKEFEKQVGDPDIALKMFIANGEKVIPDYTDRKLKSTSESIRSQIFEIKAEIEKLEALGGVANITKSMKLQDKLNKLVKLLAPIQVKNVERKHKRGIESADKVLADKHATVADVVLELENQKAWSDEFHNPTMLFSESTKEERATLKRLAGESDDKFKELLDKLKGDIKDIAASEGFDGVDFTKVKDAEWFTKWLLDLNKTDSTLAQYLYIKIESSNQQAAAEADKLQAQFLKSLDSIPKAIMDKFKELIHQSESNTDSRSTGNIVTRFTNDFSHRFSSEIKEYKKEINTIRKAGLDYEETALKIKEANKKISDKINNYYTIIDIALLKYGDKAHEQELRDILGDDYNEYVQKAEKQYEMFQVQNNLKLQEIIQDLDNQDALLREYQKWFKSNNPEYLIKNVKEEDQSTNMLNFDRLVLIPKSKSDIDSRYLEIRNNPQMYSAYKNISNTVEMLHKYLPMHEEKALLPNSIPLTQTNVFIQLRREGLKGVYNLLWDKRVNALSDKKSEHRQTETLKSKLRFANNSHIRREIRDRIRVAEMTKPLSDKEKRNIELDVINQNVNKSGLDLVEMMDTYISSAMSMKHKLNSIHEIQALKFLVQNQQTLSGEEAKGIKDMLENKMNAFYGNETRSYGLSFEGKSFEFKMYTKDEKKKKAEIQKVISELEAGPQTDENKAKLLEAQIILNDIGRYWSLGKASDNMIAQSRFIVLTYALKAATIDIVATAYRANAIAASEKYYTYKNLWKARMLMTHSLSMSLTGNALGTKTAKAIYKFAIEQSIYDISRVDLHKENTRKRYAVLRMISPFYILKSKEFVNQVLPALAVLDTIQVFKDGSQSSLLDIIKETGEIPFGLKDANGKDIYSDGMLDAKTFALVRRGIEATNGGGGKFNSVRYQNMAIGRQLGLFKTWAPDIINQWTGGERRDILEGETKGSFRSLLPFLKHYGPVYGTARIVADTLINTIPFIQPMGGNKWINTKTGEDFTQQDMKNMKFNIAYLGNVLQLLSLCLVGLKYYDDDDEKQQALMNWIEQLFTTSLILSDDAKSKNVLDRFAPGIAIAWITDYRIALGAIKASLGGISDLVGIDLSPFDEQSEVEMFRTYVQPETKKAVESIPLIRQGAAMQRLSKKPKKKNFFERNFWDL